MLCGSTPELSILNRNPLFIKGPELLHELVPSSSSTAEPAIDFLEDGSKRREFSYETLHSLSNALARQITRLQTGLENASAIIPVLLPQSPELYITHLAILKAGKAFCPLSLDIPDERLKFILKDVSADLIITDSARQSRIPASENVQVLLVDTDFTRESDTLMTEIPRIQTSDLAYVLYTSGSTGLPKAVKVSHRAVTQSLLAHDRHIPAFTRFLQFAAPTFDVSIFEVFFPLFRQKTLVGCSRSQMLNDLPKVISDLKVDAVELTPTVVSNLLGGRESVPGLKLLLTIGEMLTRYVVEEYGGNSSRKSILWGMYGPTEAAIHCTLQPDFQSDYSVGSIGFPLDTVSAFIVSPRINDSLLERITVLPIGEEGELVIGGSQVAQGYLNRPKLSAAAFIQDDEFGCLYRTGDKARILPNRTLECLGRLVSGQVKLRGQRVELGEIEQIISKVDGCHTASVMVINDNLVAFCAIGSREVSKSSVKDVCIRWLPSHMVPADIVFLPHMPQSAAGKTDKKYLEESYLQEDHRKVYPTYHPTSEAGQIILRILHRVLDRDISLNTTLATVGLDSLRAIRIASLLREEGYHVGALDVLSTIDLEELISVCGSKKVKSGTGASTTSSEVSNFPKLEIPGLVQHDDQITDILPCTPLQAAMLAETIKKPDAYCNWIETELSFPHSFTEIRDFLEKLAHHHEILRSGFCTSSSTSNSFAQVVWKKLGKYQISEVTSFSRRFCLGSSDSMLRPLTIQVNATLLRPRLLFQIHHALYDGWSFDLLMRDLGRIIDGRTVNRRPQYREVVRYYSEVQDSEEHIASSAYWSNILEGYYPTPLPNYNGSILQDSTLRAFSGKSSVNAQDLYSRASECGLNPQVFFQAAVAHIVGSYLGSSDVVIGTVTSGRTVPVTGIEEIVGPCIASLPLRCDLSSSITANVLLEQIHRANRDMLQHCTLPLRDITKICNLHPDNRLFDVLFVWQETLLDNDDETLSIRIVDSADNVEFSITLEFEPHKDCILYKIRYDPSIFPQEQIGYLSAQIDEVVNLFVHNSNGTTEDIAQCFSEQSLSAANQSPIQKRFMHGPAHAVEEWALRDPEKEALVIGTAVSGIMTVQHRLTYAALNKRANQLAHALLEHGAGNDQLVCVLMEKSTDFYVSVLAVLKTGSGYLPIVLDSPVERTKTILADARIKICISESSASQFLRDEGSYTILDMDGMDFSTYSDQNLHLEYNGSHLAYAVFTSGSTGTPKGVLVTQDNLMSNLDVLQRLYPTSNESRLLQACSQAFDVSVFEIFFTWYTGMCLCTATKDNLFHNFEDSINRLGITHLSLTPTVASLVNPNHVPKVNFLVTAGEAVNEHVRRQWADRGLYQAYGPSETTNVCTVRPAVTSNDLINNIGPPLSNTSAFVLDPESDRLIPRGGIGELCFGGAQVFRGYLNMPEMTARKVIIHPTYGRIYRSGDMGLLLPDDSILFTGRSDDQVKIRGQRVELGEVTSNILDNDVVDDCVTLLFCEENGQRLIAFWVPKKGHLEEFSPIDPYEYRHMIWNIFESLSLRVPAYMMPTHLVPISRIPMTSQTKVDKRLLESTFYNLPAEHLEALAYNYSSTGDEEVFSDAERKIVEVLAQTTGVPINEIRRTSSFFNLGLDSISAINLSGRLRDSGIANVPVSTILKNPTVALLSLQLSSGATKDVSSKGYASPISEEFFADHALNVRNDCTKQGMRVRRILPCTPLQEAMLSSAPSVMEASYFNTMVFNINGEVSRVQECWSLMIKRHEILRTAFVPTDDPQFAFAQVILDFEPIKWDRLEEVEDLQVYARRVIPPLLDSFQPPIRFATYETAASTKLIFCCHHALYDGTAISVLLNELQESYLGRELSPVVAYDSYLQRMVSQDFSAADKFWTSSFANFEPTFFPDLSGQSGHINTRSSSLTKILRYPLSGFLKSCRESSVSLLPVVQTAWIKLLHFYTGESDICFGNVVSGRSLPEENLYQLVAPCFNTLPVRLHFDYQRSNSDLVQQLHNLNIESLPFQLTPLRRIQSKVRSEGGALFDTLVILQQPNEPLDSSIWTLEQDIGDMDVPIVCEVSQNKADNWLSLTLHYRTSLLSEDDAKIVVDTFEHALESLVQFPDAAAGDTIEFPSQILAESNMDFQRLDPANGELLHSAMEYNAVSRPDSIALDFQFTHGKQTTCTFKELNEKANQIAHALLQRDVKPEDIVPVYMPKSPQFYASILGVLKAGAAFTPIHPDLPTARKQFMLQEIQPKVLLCIDDESLYWYGGIFALNVNTVEDYPRNNPTVDDILPTNLAYCLYTSGSTGVPKAVSMEHRSPIQTIESSRSLIPWTHNSRLLQYAAITFDMCYYDCFLAWSLGFALCAAEQSAMINDITSVIKSLDVDLLDLTPSVAISLSRADVPSVKWLYCIGEPISTEIIEQWNGACVNAYGPTEAAFCTTIFPVQRGVKNSVIGKPFLTTSFAVFPAKGQRSVPVFGVGELYIGGAQLARGYYGNTRLTEEKFVQRSGQRFYKSGDLVRMLGDGNFEFIGRTDDQVKIRGLRVELGEINHVLQDCDEKFSAVSTQILKKNKDAKPQLVAFLVVQASVNEQDISELKCKAKKVATSTLPAYMIPQFYIFINQIPKSMAGKVDKNALANHFQELEDSSDKTQDDSEKAHNWSNTETHIREIFARLSKTPLEEIHPYTSIYQLGLDSISAVQVAAAMRKKGYMANAADVLKHMNCADISTHLESHIISGQEVVSFDFESFDRRFRPEIVQACGVRQEDIEAVRPCTPLQRGMLSQFIANDGAVYLNHIRLQLDRGVELTCMQKAWASAMNRHVMLRTGFAHAKDSKHPFAMIHYTTSAFSVPWEDSDLEHLDPTEKWLQKLRRQTLKHLHQPPWYIRVFKMKGSMYLDLVMFHALFDATSLRAIFTDVSKIYQAAELSPTVPLEPVLSNILHQSSDQDAQHNRFWETLGKEATSTRFPNLAPLRYDSETPSVLVKSCTKPISDLETGCRASNITLQAAGLASWASLLSAYSGEPSVTFGIVLSGRNFDAAESAVIPCITTVPFVCKVSDDKGSMLAHIMSSSAEVQQHQFTPLNEIQRMMGCSNEVLFDSLFAFQKLSNGGGQEHPWTVVDEHATIEYPVSIEMEPIDGRLELRLTFLSHLIPKEHAVLILDQLDHLINNFVFLDAPPMAEASSDPILYSITPAKEDTLSSDVTLLHEFVEISAVKHPSRIAFEFATSIKDGKYTSINWTYSQLDIEGNRVAHMLIAHGICPGELVGVCFDKCPEASFAILGILKAGCAFVALDPGLPIARREFIIQDSRAKVVLSMNAQSWDMHEIPSVRVLSLDEMDLRSTLTTKPNLQREVGSQDRSYCLYTSGTTGTPKGCELTHENAVQALLSFQRLFAGHWDDQSRWLQFASFHFDVSVLEQYWSWSVGICVVSAPRDLIFEDLTTSIRTLGITHIDLTPSLARIVHPDDVPDLCKGVFITGGESLKQEILDAWGPKGVIYNGYGPTEATIGCTMYPRVPANGKPSNIGPQFDNVGSYVFRPGTEIPVLRGGVGELCVSGKLVGKGYLNRPELTEERFPHLQTFCERVYRTGDLVRILYDGSIDFLGRADDQVKLRGQRLEIGEINAVIRQAATEISDVATFVLRHPKQRKEQLVSFVVTAAKSKEKPRILLQSTRELAIAKEACQDRLPAYMVPTHFVALTALPLSTNNKADARKLKEMYEDLSVNDLQILSGPTDAEDDKWSRQEKKIRDVLREMLQVGEVDIKKGSSFFELGMDSVSVIGFSRALKQAGFSKAVASLIMKNTTISRLAKALSKKNHTPSDRGSILAAQQSITAIQHRHRRDIARALFMDPREIEAIAPCTPLQQGMIARSLDNGEGLYFNTFLFKLDKDVDMDKLQDAWQQMIESTQILRTVFWNTEDGFVQAALKRLRFPWKTCSISNNEALDEFLHELKRKWLQDNRMVPQRPFEVILVDAPKGKTLVVHIFHALYDGNSIVMMFKAIWNIYNDRPSEKPGPSFQSALAYGPLRVIEGAQAFWKEHIRRSSFNLLSAHANGSDKGTIEITRELRNLSKYESVRRQLNVTAQAIAQACWATVLNKHTKHAVTIGMVMSGRSFDFEHADRIVGPLFNTIPHPNRIRNGDTWATIIKSTHDFNVAAHPYQHTPLRDIAKWCRPSLNQPLLDTLFVFQAADTDEEWMKNDVWTLEVGGAEADYPLALEVEQNPGGSFKLTLVAQGNALDELNSIRLLDEFEEALRDALDAPDATVEGLSVDGTDWSTTEQMEPKSASVSFDGAKDFKWTIDTLRMREEVANLAGVEMEVINEATSIFELGLDSIDAIKLSSKLKKHNINLAVSSIMRGRTIANMAINILKSKIGWAQRPSDMIFRAHIRRLEAYLQRQRGQLDYIEKVLPLTPLQEAMVAEMVASDYTRYYNHDVLKLAPDTDVEQLRHSWLQVVKGSPILRTSFVEIDDPHVNSSFAQVVQQSPHDFWKHMKTSGIPDFPRIFDTIREDVAKTPLASPLFHVHFIDSGAQKYLVLSIAHALYDGWSLGLLHSDVHRAYLQHYKPRPGYDYALLVILTTSGAEAAGFWRDFLSEAKPSHFPRRVSEKDKELQIVHREELTTTIALNTIASFAKKNNITLQTLGQTVYALVLAYYAQSLDVTFGSVLSGRDNEDTSEILFPTMNTVAIRTILHGTRREMLQYVQDNFTNIKQWQHFPLRKAQALARIPGNLLGSLFIYQKRADARDSLGPKLYESVESRSDVEYPVCVEMEVINKELLWRCAVKDGVLDKAGARDLLQRLDEVLKTIIEQPDAPVVEFLDTGRSICGLPTFKDEKDEREEKDEDSDHEGSTSEEQVPSRSESVTAKAIRETLALVSKIPEDEIAEGMTIFHIGLDSISAIKVSSLLRKRSIILSVGEMLKAGTVEKMAQVVDQRAAISKENDNDTEAILNEALSVIDRAAVLDGANIEVDNIEQILPATAGQIYMLSMWLNSNGTKFYPSFSYNVNGLMSISTLQTAWQAFVKLNPILRTCFLTSENSSVPYIQVVLKDLQPEVMDTTGWDEQRISDTIEKDAHKQPYCHLFASQLPNGWSLTLKIHHALYDGVSLPLMMDQLQGFCNGNNLPPAINTFNKLLAANYTASALENRKTFWTNYLHGIEQHDLGQSSSPSTSKIEIFKHGLLPTVKILNSLARKNGVSTQSLFLAAYAKIYAGLKSTAKDQDVVIGIYLANRSLPIPNITSATIPTVNLVPLRISRPLETNILDVAAQIQYDIQEISIPANSMASLYDIYVWTGIKIDTFVNFLKLPDSDGSTTSSKDRDIVNITPVGQWNEDVSRVEQTPHSGFETPKELVDESVCSVYMHAIDIEATIQDGALDVGVFSPEGKIGLEEGMMLVESIRRALEGLEDVDVEVGVDA